MNVLKMLSGFLPFIAFSLLVHAFGVMGAAIAGVVTAIVVVALTAQGGIRILPCLQAVILLVMAVVAGLGDDATRSTLVTWGPVVASFLIAAFMIGTAWKFPFTAQQARHNVPQQVWYTRTFLDTNRRISIAWGLAVLVVGLGHLATTGIDPDGIPVVLRLLINWAVVVVAFWRAAVYTKHTAAQAAERLRHVPASTAGNGS